LRESPDAPGGNITAKQPCPEAGTKRLQLLTELPPGAKRVRVLFIRLI
jgi:hypothetical protein